MKTTLSTKAFSLSVLLAFSLIGPASAAELTSSEPAVKQVQPAVKAHKSKSRKRYSKATLSALQPQSAAPGQAPAPAFNSAASIALSPVVNKNAVQPLPEKSAVLLPESASSSIAIPTASSQAYDEESSLAQHEMATETVADSDALGQESVSVIDRFADKPKAKPITEGPLRVKMKDSGLRASVQIPLTQKLQ